MRTSLPAILAIASLSFLAPPTAFAIEPLDAALPGEVSLLDESLPVAADAPPAAPVEVADFAAPMAVDALDDLRGGSNNRNTTTNLSDLDGRVDGNTATGIVTGTNLVDGGAFGNAAGLSTIIQNSGNNVLIQNSTIVSVQFVPTP